MTSKESKEIILQAVVIAESFDERFSGLEIPFALVPIGGRTLLDYTLESLSLTEAKEVIIVCGPASATLLRQHVQLYWSQLSPFKISIEISQKSHGAGDLMRHLDSKHAIKGDFIMLNVGCIFNTDLKDAVSEHRKRRSKDLNAIMTHIYASCAPSHPSRSRLGDVVVMIHPESKEILHCQDLDSEGRFEVPLVTLVLLDADSVFANGNLYCKSGSNQIMLAAKSNNIPVLVCCQTFKFSDRLVISPGDRTNVKGNQALESASEEISSDLVSGIVTELRLLPCSSAPAIIRSKLVT